MTDILVIPDSHVKPSVGHDRFTWAGNLCADLRPDVIVHLGDFFDMDSLCEYDRGTRSAQGRRYSDNLKSGRLAAEKFDLALRHKKKGYNPVQEFLEGNHDGPRITKFVEQHPEMDGFMDEAACKEVMASLGWNTHDFLEPVTIEDVTFMHYFVSGVMARPVGGQRPAQAILRKAHQSIVTGHSHLWDYAMDTTAARKKIISLVAGVFLEPGQRERYAGAANDLWWNGLTLLKGVHEGNFDIEQFSIKRLKDLYA